MRLLLVILFTGPMNEMPPALNATGWAVGEDDWVVVGCCTCVVDVVGVLVVELVVDCRVLVAVQAHAETNKIITIAAVCKSIPWTRMREFLGIVVSCCYILVCGS